MCTRQETITRLHELITLQSHMEAEFGSDNYNIFVFGSYITNQYENDRSDIDIAIYTPDFRLYKRLSCYLEEYFNQKQQKNDIFYIDISTVAPVYLAALNSKIQFTDYYPEELNDFCVKCGEKLEEEKRRLVG